MIAAGALNYNHQNANGTYVISAVPCILHTVSINIVGASVNRLTLYDNTSGSGTIIAVINTTSALQTFVYDVACQTGLTAVMATGTAADITISYV